MIAGKDRCPCFSQCVVPQHGIQRASMDCQSRDRVDLFQREWSGRVDDQVSTIDFQPVLTKKITGASLGYFPSCTCRRNHSYKGQMFSHIVIFWTDPADPNAADQVAANAAKYLPTVPGVVNFHVGKMVRSHRGVVDQSYQVGLNIQFETKQAQDEYQDHPVHLEFVEKSKAFFNKVVVYDFE
jgi:hypothetical protein